MFSLKKKNKVIPMGKIEYENVMQIVKYEFEDSNTLTEKLAVLEYIMEAVRQDL